MVKKDESCELCGLKIVGSPVVRDIGGEEKHFCCEGCARVYQLAYDNDMLGQILPPAKPKRPGIRDVLLERGETASFSLSGMWCSGCALAAEQMLRREPGVKMADVSFAAEMGRIQYDPDRTDLDAVLRRLEGLGYNARLLSSPDQKQAERKQEKTFLQFLVAAAFGMQVMFLYIEQLYPLYAQGRFGSPDVRNIQYVTWLLATPVLLYGGNSFFRGAWQALRARTATMDTLVALGTLSAYLYSVYVTLTGSGEAYFDSVVMITTFVMFGRYLESVGGARARKDIRHLLQMRPEKALRLSGNDWKEVDASKLAPGDTILIKAGERVPVDAEILAGHAAVEESLLTGEASPVEKGAGDPVYAGTVVTDAPLNCRVTRRAEETRLAHITRTVEQTLATKPPIQRLADRASAYFAAGILAAALLSATGWWFVSHNLAVAVLNAVAVLVVACPCALGLATPLALAITLGRTTSAGILVRNPASLETAAKSNRVVFDKTGTLTRGRLSVVAAEVLGGTDLNPDRLLCLAASVERYSEHPLARAIVKACPADRPESEDFQMLRGLGAAARVLDSMDRRVMVGSARFLEVDEKSPRYDGAARHSRGGETVVWVGWDNTVAGFIALRDEPNPTAREAIGRLRAQGILSVMLSGDNAHTTAAVAEELGLKEYGGNCLPEEKAARIRDWQKDGEWVAMVGDGVNDAPALAQADLSITTAGGTDVAGETSDVVLMRGDLTLIPWLIRMSRRTRRTIVQNLGWAFAYNLVAVPLAALGVISPVIAAGAMATSSLLVVGNSLRLGR